MIRRIVVLAMLLTLPGCSELRFMWTTEPATPLITKSVDLIDAKFASVDQYGNEIYRARYDHYFANFSTARAKTERNKIMFEMMVSIDNQHQLYMTEFRNSKARKDVLTDFVVLGLNAAGAVTGGEAIKSILSATSAGVVGASTSIDKEYLANLTIQAIDSQMSANIINARNTIIQKMANPVEQYPLEAALQDVLIYYQAGTLTQALTDMAASTTSNLKKAMEYMPAQAGQKKKKTEAEKPEAEEPTAKKPAAETPTMQLLTPIPPVIPTQ